MSMTTIMMMPMTTMRAASGWQIDKLTEKPERLQTGNLGNVVSGIGGWGNPHFPDRQADETITRLQLSCFLYHLATWNPGNLGIVLD